MGKVLSHIQRQFGLNPVNLIHSLDTLYPGEQGVVHVPLTPDVEINPSSLCWGEPLDLVRGTSELANKLVSGISSTKHAVPGLLYPGDAVHQSKFYATNVMTGAAGVFLALHRSGVDISHSDVQWLQDTLALQQSGDTDYGWLTGLTGIGEVLLEIGQKDLGLSLLNQAAHNWRSVPTLDLAKGLSGIGLCLLAVGESRENEFFIRTARDIGEYIISCCRITPHIPCYEDVANHPGLYYGLAGVSLFMSQLALRFPASSFASFGEQVLVKELDNYSQTTRGGQQQILDKKNHRLMPYLADGSAGEVIAIAALRKIRDKDNALEQRFQGLLSACSSPEYAFPGLNEGRAGILVASVSSICYMPRTVCRRQIERLVSSLYDYCLSYKEHLVVPGDSLLRLSSDYSTGAAGIVLALLSAKQGRILCFPLPSDIALTNQSRGRG